MAITFAVPANAHPHVWIETKAAFNFDHGKLIAVDLDWLFDEIFSAQMIEDFDHGKKGHFDAMDAAELEKQVLPGYGEKEFGWFTHVREDGKEVTFARAGNFKPTLENGQVRFRFTLYLARSLDPIRHKVEAGLYDPTFFDDLGLSVKDPIILTGIKPGECSDTILPDHAHKIYFGQVTPEVIKFTCKPI
jgi:tRNA threonylcarbamoyladenosine biosynthesis protein TsaE